MAGRGDKGNQKVDPTKIKKRKQPPSYIRPTGIHISEGRFADELARPSYSRLSQNSVPTPTHVGPLHGSTAAHSAPIPVPPPLQYYQTTVGTFRHLPSSAVPSTSIHPHSYSDSGGSIRLTDFHLGGTSSGASDPPTPVHPPALVSYLRDRDDYQRWYIIPYGIGFMPDDGVGKIMTKCIRRHFNGYWTSWQKVPEYDRE
ncbi:uncharacterized protein LOC107879213 [Capsicum annuum]|uniref:uncharacterized protein LOC107879213 n=1 Tax=Capsicum annuum TaxID=4072 RepID=UPI0007BEC942|nr:uncharacterized protein LOC107879213 [Capsicum annuum]